MKLNILCFVFISLSVCFLFSSADAHCGWWCWGWRWRNRCQTETTLTIVSSECAKTMTGVRITSWRYMRIVSSSNGEYKIKACRLPLYVKLRKRGYRTMRVDVRHYTETFTMTCRGRGCQAKRVDATISSDCSGPLEGVSITSTDLLSVTSSLPGNYRLRVCSVPADITCQKEGFEPVTKTITGTSVAVQMACPASCDAIQKTISIMSSDCSKPVSDVTITSQEPLNVTSSAAGSYELSVCSLPATVSLVKSGYASSEVTVTAASDSEITLQCSGSSCSTETATVTVTSDCTPAVMGVTLTSAAGFMETSSSGPGIYEISACSLPVDVTSERNGYIPVTQEIAADTTVSLSCIVRPFITEDPQSKYRAPGDHVKMCCQAGPALSSLEYKWFKDGIQIQGETNNEITLYNIVTGHDGLYKCAAKLTASDTIPAAMSAEAHLTVTDDPDDYSNSLVDRIVQLRPGCSRNLKQCIPRPCRTDPIESCSDDMVVCEETETRQVDCADDGITIPVVFVTGCSCSCTAPTVLVDGVVFGSDTDAPIEGIDVMLNGKTTVYTTDADGQFSVSVPSTVRRLIVKATDPDNDYIDAIMVTDIPANHLGAFPVAIVMKRRAPFIQIDQTQDNELAISNTPSELGTGVASITIPANAFYTSDGSPFTGQVSVSLTYLDPHDPDMLAMSPGRFVTRRTDGEEDILVTQGVFSTAFADSSGNELVFNGEMSVFGTPGFALWEFDSDTATWAKIKVDPGRKRRQVTQQEYLGSFNPQNVSWWNIDRVLSEPDCFFKVRVFQDNFAPSNEITSGLRFIPEISQLIESQNAIVRYYVTERNSPCISMKCPATIAQATIRIRGLETVYGTTNLQVSLLPADISEYSTDIRSVLEVTPYFYSLLQNDTSTLFINTPLNETGPFYPTEESCLNATINDNAFWFTKETDYVEDDFDDDFEGRCVAKIEIKFGQGEMPSNSTDYSSNNLTALSIWGENNYGHRIADMDFVSNNSYEVVYEACIEYRCSRSNGTHNDTTRVVLGISNETQCYFKTNYSGADGSGDGFPAQRRSAQFFGPNFIAPIIDPADVPSGFFYSNTTDVQPALSDCLSSSGNYTGMLYCYPKYRGGWR